MLSERQTAGLDRDRLNQIARHTEARIRNQTLACAATLVARNNEVAWYRQQGYADWESKKPLAPQALFRLASMTKPITAAAVLIQMERGLLSLTDPVSCFIESFRHPLIAVVDDEKKLTAARPAIGEIRLIDLLTHSSGLGHGLFKDGRHQNASFYAGCTLADLIPRTGRDLLDFEPGSQAGYSGLLGFDTLAYVVELTSGLSLADFFRQNIFDPLGIGDMTFQPTPEQAGRLVSLYADTASGLQQVIPAGGHIADIPVSYTSGGASLLGTLEDYYRFAAMLLNEGELDGRRVLQPSSVRLMRQAALPDDLPGLSKGINWGLGVRVITSQTGEGMPLSQGSFGWSGAYGTHFWVDPALGLVAVYCSNMTTAGGSGALTAREFECDVMQAIVEPAS
jgi:CubicO group peptidase (beta-lactamase class C family)